MWLVASRLESAGPRGSVSWSLRGLGWKVGLTYGLWLWAGRVLTGQAGWKLKGIQRCLATFGLAGTRQVWLGARGPGKDRLPPVPQSCEYRLPFSL